MPPRYSQYRSGDVENHPPITIGAVYPFRIAHLPRKGKAFMAKRENGSGSIVRRKLAHGTKYVVYAPTRYERIDGIRKAVRLKIGSFGKKADARAALEDYLKHPTSKFDYTLRMLYEDWKSISFADIAKQTQGNYTTCWKKICACEQPKIADKPIREITTADMRRVLDYYLVERTLTDPKTGNDVTKKPLSKSYITKIKALLTQLYDYAVENNIVDRNYASLVKLPKMEGSKARAFTDLEFAKLERNWSTIPGGDACLVLCYTGFRVTEFCQLTRFSYDPKTKTLTGGLKTDAGRDRVVPVHPKILPIIERWHKASKGPLYPRTDGKAYNKDNFRTDVWRPCMDALGLPEDLTPHSARHTCGTRLSAAGAAPEDIQRIMGHADYSITANTYINQDIAALKAAMERVS